MLTENEHWPPLPYDEWKDTYATLHMWTQIVGKIALAQAPPINQSWAVALQLTPRGLSTRTLPHGNRTFTMEFDFLDHRLMIRTSDGIVQQVALAPRSVADFYRDVMSTMKAMDLPVKIWPMAVEIPAPMRLDTDEVHHTYDPVHARRCWTILSEVGRVLEGTRCDFVGKCSPVHFRGLTWRSPGFRDGRRRRAKVPRSCRRPIPRKSSATASGSAAVPCWSRPLRTPYRSRRTQSGARSRAARSSRRARRVHPPVRNGAQVRFAGACDRAFVESTYDQAATLARWNRPVLERAGH
jgi:hypothetical protein